MIKNNETELKRNFKGVWIPSEIWLDNNLSWIEKLLLVEIDSLDNEEGCFATNAHFADFFNLSKDRISKLISRLSKKGYISVNLVYKKRSNEIDKRVIKNNYTYRRKQLGGIGENNYTSRRKQLEGIVENDEGNNTTNNTINKDIVVDSSQNIHLFYQKNFGIESPFIFQDLENWINDLSAELVLEALKRALESNKQYSYTKSIIKNWANKNIKTLDQVFADDLAFKNSFANKSAKKQNQPVREEKLSDCVVQQIENSYEEKEDPQMQKEMQERLAKYLANIEKKELKS